MSIFQIAVSESCLRAVEKMNTCPVCLGYADIKPCNNYCLNVMKGCLAYHIEIQDQWDQYVGEAALKSNLPEIFLTPLANSLTM
jgi:hypothetical protein